MLSLPVAVNWMKIISTWPMLTSWLRYQNQIFLFFFAGHKSADLGHLQHILLVYLPSISISMVDRDSKYLLFNEVLANVE